jgi:hypothetical protein
MIPTHGTWYFDLNGFSVAQGLDLNLISACYMYNDIQYIINACNSTKQTSPTASSYMLVKVSFRFCQYVLPCTIALSVVCLTLSTQSVLNSWWMLSTPTLPDV